ncbi:MAG: hypothetical protein DI611_03885 [Brachybacterium faecium]|nr:MAG: hypothetical protein DI611_03885 [Brachybacterium faecium]
MSNVLRARAVLGHASRTGDPGRVADARRDLAAANLEQYIGKVTADAPPLTDEQRDHLAALIRQGANR